MNVILGLRACTGAPLHGGIKLSQIQIQIYRVNGTPLDIHGVITYYNSVTRSLFRLWISSFADRSFETLNNWFSANLHRMTLEVRSTYIENRSDGEYFSRRGTFQAFQRFYWSRWRERGKNEEGWSAFNGTTWSKLRHTPWYSGIRQVSPDLANDVETIQP